MGRRFIAIVGLALFFGCAHHDNANDAPANSEPSTAGANTGKADGITPENQLDWATIQTRCSAPTSEEPTLYSNAFTWGVTLESMAEKFDEIYGSSARLFGRAWFDETRDVFIMPDKPNWGGEVILSRRLIDSVRGHIERALALGYADFVFFPDMGHSHLFIPQDRWDEAYAGFEVSALSSMRTALLDDPELRVLYHTAEQLTLVDEAGEIKKDRYLMWRYFTRNPVGDNRGGGRLELARDLSTAMNTVRKFPGHHYYSSGFNVSANAKGCFPFVHDGQVRYFDLSLFDLPSDRSAAEANSF